MIKRANTSRYRFGEEIANSISHGIGIILAIAGLAILVTLASIFGTAWHIVGCSIYGSTLVLLYTASTLYHSIQQPRAKAVLKILDHSGIFLLIAGTYTPFMLVNPSRTMGLVSVWRDHEGGMPWRFTGGDFFRGRLL